MAMFFVPGRGYVNDQDDGVDIPFYGSLQLPDGSLIAWGDQGVREVPWLDLPSQYGSETYGTRFQWEPGLGGQTPSGYDVHPGYVPTLLDWSQAAAAGTLGPVEQPQWEALRQQAMAVPLRDVSQLYWGYTPREDDPEGLRLLNAMSPDVGRFLLETRGRIAQGTATPHERQLAQQIEQQGRDWDWRATTPQPSDAFSPLGDQFMMALNALSLATGGAGSFGAFGAAAGAGAAGAAGAGAAAPSLLGIPTSTLSTIGTLSGLGAMGTGMLGTALQQPWLQKLAMGLGVVGGLAGGTAGIANTLSGGISSLGEAGRLLSSAGRVTGALGTASGSEALARASGFLRLGGGLGSTAGGVFEGDGGGAPAASDLVTQRAAGGPMDFDYSWDYGGATPYWEGVDTTGGWWDDPSGGNFTYVPPSFTSWGEPYGPGSSGDPAFSGEGSGNWWSGLTSTLGGLTSTLGSLAPLLGPAVSGVGSLAPLLGPAVSGVGSLVSGGLGARASQGAAEVQSAALNRALALQEAMWMENVARQAPWIQAGQEALGHMAGRSTWDQPTLGQMAAINPADYRAGLPGATPGWSPQSYGGYTPTEIPSAAGYRYAPGQGPRAGDFLYTPGAVPTLSGQELLANDPGYQFRQDEARRALEASAAARGGLTSGATLSALGRQAQDIASNEYGQAWNRAAQQAQMREQWQQYATQQGWSQAQAEAAFREQLASQASAQNWGQALQEAQARAQQGQFGWQAGFQAQQQGQRERQQYDADLYQRMMGLNQLGYSRDLEANQTAYQRMVDQYNALRQGQNQAWNQFSTLAGYGPTALSQLTTAGQAGQTQMNSLLGQLGSSQALGTLGASSNWVRGIGGVTNNLTDLLAGLNR